MSEIPVKILGTGTAFAIMPLMAMTVTLSEKARALAEKRAREEGFETVDAYVGALIEEDKQEGTILDWMRERIQEGLDSGSAGELARTKLDRLIHENHESTLGGNPVWGAVVTEIQVPVPCK